MLPAVSDLFKSGTLSHSWTPVTEIVEEFVKDDTTGKKTAPSTILHTILQSAPQEGRAWEDGSNSDEFEEHTAGSQASGSSAS